MKQDFDDPSKTPSALTFTLTKELKLSLLTVYFSAFIDYLSLSIVQPILPFYSQKFNANGLELGLLFSTYSLTQAIGSYIMGKTSDRITGRKPMILLSMFGSALGFFLTGIATNYTILLIYRLIGGLFGSTIPVAQAYVTDTIPDNTSNNARQIYLSYISIVNAVASAIGPVIGSAFAQISIKTAFFGAGGIAFMGFLLSIFTLKESHFPKRNENENKNNNNNNNNNSNTGNETKTTINDKSEPNSKTSNSGVPVEVYLIALGTFFGTLSFTTFTAMFGILLIDEYNVGTLGIGLIYLEFCVVYILSTAIAFRNLLKKFKVFYAGIIGGCFAIAGFILFTIPNNVYIALVMAQLIAFGWGIIVPSLPVMTASFDNSKDNSDDVDDDNNNNNNNGSRSGEYLAINATGVSCGFVVGPILQGFVYDIDRNLMMYEAAGCVFANITIIAIVYFMCKKEKTVQLNTTQAVVVSA